MFSKVFHIWPCKLWITYNLTCVMYKKCNNPKQIESLVIHMNQLALSLFISLIVSQLKHLFNILFMCVGKSEHMPWCTCAS